MSNDYVNTLMKRRETRNLSREKLVKAADSSSSDILHNAAQLTDLFSGYTRQPKFCDFLAKRHGVARTTNAIVLAPRYPTSSGDSALFTSYRLTSKNNIYTSSACFVPSASTLYTHTHTLLHHRAFLANSSSSSSFWFRRSYFQEFHDCDGQQQRTIKDTREGVLGRRGP